METTLCFAPTPAAATPGKKRAPEARPTSVGRSTEKQSSRSHTTLTQTSLGAHCLRSLPLEPQFPEDGTARGQDRDPRSTHRTTVSHQTVSRMHGQPPRRPWVLGSSGAGKGSAKAKTTLRPWSMPCQITPRPARPRSRSPPVPPRPRSRSPPRSRSRWRPPARRARCPRGAASAPAEAPLARGSRRAGRGRGGGLRAEYANLRAGRRCCVKFSEHRVNSGER